MRKREEEVGLEDEGKEWKYWNERFGFENLLKRCTFDAGWNSCAHGQPSK